MENTNKSEESQRGDISYYANLYYGIHFPTEHMEVVQDAVCSESRYRGIFGDDREIESCGYTYFKTLNSDITESRCVIAIDEFTQQTEVDDLRDAFVLFEPSELAKIEEDNAKAVNFITDIYDLCVKRIKSTVVDKKKKREILDSIKLGWGFVNCSWEDGSEESSSE